jgi:hypothetical protein
MPSVNLIVFCCILSTIFLGCSSTPQYAIIDIGKGSNASKGEGIYVKGGWEFRFPETLGIKKTDIEYKGSLSKLSIYSQENGRWKNVTSANVQDISSSPLLLQIDVNTNAIRIIPEYSGRGKIILCRFYLAEERRVLTIPLEKPPFIK